jgi:hypothetical protein
MSRNVELRYGLNSIYYKFNPGDVRPTGEDSGINEFKLTDKFAFENAVYLDAEIRLTDKLTAQGGIRLSTFNRLGQKELNVYENDNPINYNASLNI